MTGRTHDLVVVGGGIIGLTCAWEAARRGLRVMLVERDTPGRAASWAAAGLVAPQHNAAGPGPFLDLLLRSRAMFPGFLEELGAPEAGWRSDGCLVVAPDSEQAADLQAAVRWQRGAGLQAEWCDPGQVRALESAVEADIAGGALYPNDADLDARALVTAVLEAARRVKVQIEAQTEIRAIERSGDRVTGVAARDRRYPAGAVLLAAGAWSACLARGFRLPLCPSKGQMCAVRFAGLRRPVRIGSGTLVPRPAGRTLVGGTEEDVGFDSCIDPTAIANMRCRAEAVVPGVARAEIVETWAGFRPVLPDGHPALGEGSLRGCYVATGHASKGIALAPITARLMTDLIADGIADPLLTAFSPTRFT